MQRVIFIILLLSLLTNGCVTMQIREKNIRVEQRIAAKEQELQALEKQRIDLEYEKERLLTELDTKQMTLDELLANLKNLENKNAHLRAHSKKSKNQKLNFEKQIRQYKKEVSALQDGERLSDEDKEKRIKELKEKIRNYLILGLDKK